MQSGEAITPPRSPLAGTSFSAPWTRGASDDEDELIDVEALDGVPEVKEAPPRTPSFGWQQYTDENPSSKRAPIGCFWKRTPPIRNEFKRHVGKYIAAPDPDGTSDNHVCAGLITDSTGPWIQIHLWQTPSSCRHWYLACDPRLKFLGHFKDSPQRGAHRLVVPHAAKQSSFSFPLLSSPPPSVFPRGVSIVPQDAFNPLPADSAPSEAFSEGQLLEYASVRGSALSSDIYFFPCRVAAISKNNRGQQLLTIEGVNGWLEGPRSVLSSDPSLFPCLFAASIGFPLGKTLLPPLLLHIPQATQEPLILTPPVSKRRSREQATPAKKAKKEAVKKEEPAAKAISPKEASSAGSSLDENLPPEGEDEERKKKAAEATAVTDPSQDFDWDELIEREGGERAPRECFWSRGHGIVNGFEGQEHKFIAAPDPEAGNSDAVCAAEIIQVQGPFVKVHLYQTDTDRICWYLADDPRLMDIAHFVEARSMGMKMLVPPTNCRVSSDYHRRLHADIFAKGDVLCPPSAFHSLPSTARPRLPLQPGHLLEYISGKHSSVLHGICIYSCRVDRIEKRRGSKEVLVLKCAGPKWWNEKTVDKEDPRLIECGFAATVGVPVMQYVLNRDTREKKEKATKAAPQPPSKVDKSKKKKRMSQTRWAKGIA